MRQMGYIPPLAKIETPIKYPDGIIPIPVDKRRLRPEFKNTIEYMMENIEHFRPKPDPVLEKYFP